MEPLRREIPAGAMAAEEFGIVGAAFLIYVLE
jgi:hypothetical protein